MHLSPKQTAVLVHGTGSVNLLDGAIRSGKTLAANLAWLRFVKDAPPGHLAIMGKTRDTIGRNVLAGIEELHPSAINWREGSSRCTILGRTAYLIGANDKQAESKLRGLTLAGALLDEATLVDKPFFQTLLGRLSVHGARLYATTNPDTPAHWLNMDYIARVRRRELPGWRVWRFGLDDNPSLTAEYKAKIKRELTGLWYRRMVLGEWVAAEGAVYEMWDPSVHVIPWSALPAMHRLLAVGIDYGTNNPTVAILLGISHDGRLFMVDEWKHDGRSEGRWTDNQLAGGLLGWMNQPHLPGTGPEPMIEYLVIDPSAASLQTEFYSRNVFNLRAADNRVTFGVQQVASLLHTRKLFVSDRCTGWIDEAPGYSWDDKAALLGEDKVRKVGDHCLVAGTMIETMSGPQPIEAVQVGTLVATRNGWRPVVDAWKVTDSARVFDVALSNGRTLTGTGNHKLWAADQGWVTIDALRYADTLVGWDQQSKPSPTTGEPTGVGQTVRTAQTASTSPGAQGIQDFTSRSGLTTTGRFLPGIMCTTQITTRSTTPLTTLCVSLVESICRTTPATLSMLRGQGRTWPGSARWPLPGTAAQRVWLGTRNTAGKSQRTGDQCKLCATSAALGLSPSLLAGSARTGVSPLPADRRAWTTLRVSARIAALDSWSTDTSAACTVPVRVLSVRERPDRVPVFDLTVYGEHEFFAAGVLASNSMDAGRYAVATTMAEWRTYVDLAA